MRAMKRSFLALSLVVSVAALHPASAAPCPTRTQSAPALNATVGAEFPTACAEYERSDATQSAPAVSFGDDKGVVAWVDQRSEPARVVATRVTDRDDVLDPAGIWLPAANQQAEPDVAWNGESWLTVWTEGAEAATEVRASRIDAGGNVMDTPSVLVSAGSGPSAGRLDDGWLVAWRTADAIRVARVDGAAQVQDAGGIALSAACTACSAPALATNAGAAVVTWTDGEALWASAFDPAATAPAPVRIARGVKRGFAIADAGRSFFVVYGTEDGVRARRLTRAGAPTGDRIAVSSRGGAPVIATVGAETTVGWRVRDGERKALRLATLTADGATDVRTGPSAAELADVDIASAPRGPLAAWAQGTSVRATSFKGDGTARTAAGVPVGFEARGQDEAAIAWNGSKYLVAWRNEADAIRAALVTPTDEGYTAQATIAISDRLIKTAEPAVAWNGGRFLVVWSDGDVLGARLSAAGELLDDEPLVLSRSDAREIEPSVASDGGAFLVSWTVRGADDGNDDVRATRVTAAGEVLDRPALHVAGGDLDEGLSSVAAGEDGYVVAWQETAEGETPDTNVHTRFVANDGELAEAGVALAAGPLGAWEPSVITAEDGFLVTWAELVPPARLLPIELPIVLPTEEADPHHEVRGAFLDAAGALGSDGVFMVARTNERPLHPTSASTGIGYVVAWSVELDDKPLSGLRISETGAAIDSAPFAIAQRTANGRALAAPAPGDTATIGYLRAAPEAPWGGGIRAFVRRIDGS